MKRQETLNDFKNQLARQQMAAEVEMGVRRLSYEDFKRKARAHQIDFRVNELEADYDTFPNVLTKSKAQEGVIFFEGFREEIMEELKKPVAPTSTHYSGQMLTNLLRSEHIPYNIFFPMKKDLEGCKRLFNKILGKEEISSIEDILIEYHPEPIADFLDDHTSFDVYIPYLNQSNQCCGIGIEVKYTEKEYPLKLGTAEYNHVKDAAGNVRLIGPYADVTKKCGYYKADVTAEKLVSNKFRQIWRNHILGASMVLHGDIATFTSVTLFPQENVHFSMDAMPKYKEMLTDEYYQSCVPLTYENLFEQMDQCLHLEKKEEWMKYLKRRYLINYFEGVMK